LLYQLLLVTAAAVVFLVIYESHSAVSAGFGGAVAAFLLGILTSISPCPLATNIAAVGFLSKEIKTPKNTLLNALFYIIGRGISYAIIASLIYFGLSSFTISGIFQGWGEKLLAPVLILLGLVMLGVLKINFTFKSGKWREFKQWLSGKGYLGSMGLGMIFAMAFCPYSGVLFFGVLMPLILKSSEGILLAPSFALGTGLPVAIFAILMVFSLQKMSRAYNVTRKIEKWVRSIVSFLFIGVGLYYLKYTFGIEHFDIFYPLEALANWLTFSVFDIEQSSHLGSSFQFFFYDTFKIFALLLVITHFMSALRYYLPIEKLRDFLTKRKLYGVDYFLATVFGSITPFCSCSSIPLFIGFLEARIPLGVTFAFMITSPLINEVAIALFLGIFGWQVTLLYIAAGIVIGMVGGVILGKLKMEKYVEDFVWKVHAQKQNLEQKKESLGKVFPQISREAFSITKKIAIYILIGVGVGAFIHGYVPEGFFGKYLESAGFWGVPLATILAVPMYANASGVIPIIQSLVAKGVPLGTALAFMMAVVGLSFPEALILKKVLKWQLLATFFGVVTIGIILIGYLFNALNIT